MADETKKCPYCAEEILIAAIKCKHCGSDLSDGFQELDKEKTTKSDYGVFLLLAPLIGSAIIWLWVGNLTIYQDPLTKLIAVIAATIIFTATVAALEANKVEQAHNEQGSPVWIFIVITLMWVLFYPGYFIARRKCGLPNNIFASIIVTLIFAGITLKVYLNIMEQMSNIQGFWG